jgi:hypothetical protein
MSMQDLKDAMIMVLALAAAGALQKKREADQKFWKDLGIDDARCRR